MIKLHFQNIHIASRFHNSKSGLANGEPNITLQSFKQIISMAIMQLAMAISSVMLLYCTFEVLIIEINQTKA